MRIGEGAVKFGVMYNTGVYGVDPDAMITVARHQDELTGAPRRVVEPLARDGDGLGLQRQLAVLRVVFEQLAVAPPVDGDVELFAGLVGGKATP